MVVGLGAVPVVLTRLTAARVGGNGFDGVAELVEIGLGGVAQRVGHAQLVVNVVIGIDGSSSGKWSCAIGIGKSHGGLAAELVVLVLDRVAQGVDRGGNPAAAIVGRAGHAAIGANRLDQSPASVINVARHAAHRIGRRHEVSGGVVLIGRVGAVGIDRLR